VKPQYVKDLAAGQEASSVFLVKQKDIRQKRSGEPYLSLTLADRTGDLDAKMWDNAGPVAETFDKDDFVQVRGTVQIFQNRPQLTISRLNWLDPKSVDMADFLRASKRDPAEMFLELKQIILAIGNPHLRALLAAFFADDEVARAYRLAPAAKSVHHAYVGGLLEHVLSMAGLARFTASHYEGIDGDLLMAGVILHDIGKIRELTYDRSFGYSTEGQLIGHIQIALRMLGEKIRAVPGFPPKLRVLLEHMILSHHGELEYGSPKVPLFPEAMLLHQIDAMDSRMNSFASHVESDTLVEGEWTAYVQVLERPLLKKDRFLAEGAVTVPASSPVPQPVASAETGGTTGFADQLAQAWKRS
jgi:3'-5' exoribonuclease